MDSSDIKQAKQKYESLNACSTVRWIVMRFAQTEEATSKLSKAWRERDHAKVRQLPPYHIHHLTTGFIDVPLTLSCECLKQTMVAKSNSSGKSSTTLWRVDDDDVKTSPASGIILALTPVYGLNPPILHPLHACWVRPNNSIGRSNQ